jgi:hypothetical protein
MTNVTQASHGGVRGGPFRSDSTNKISIPWKRVDVMQEQFVIIPKSATARHTTPLPWSMHLLEVESVLPHVKSQAATGLKVPESLQSRWLVQSRGHCRTRFPKAYMGNMAMQLAPSMSGLSCMKGSENCGSHIDAAENAGQRSCKISPGSA